MGAFKKQGWGSGEFSEGSSPRLGSIGAPMRKYRKFMPAMPAVQAKQGEIHRGEMGKWPAHAQSSAQGSGEMGKWPAHAQSSAQGTAQGTYKAYQMGKWPAHAQSSA